MIKQANETNILEIEEILLDAVLWMRKNKLENKWNEENIKWSWLSKEYEVSDFYISYQNGMPAGCMAITDIDQKYWPELPKEKSLYIHKLAVKREFAGRGISKELINLAKDLAVKRNINALRLDCNLHRDKLRRLYENEGFIYVDKKGLVSLQGMALYAWQVDTSVK